ncbi:response regulator receiver protein [Paraburkholderia hospita]|uniref:Response regulator receiver protein n=2 Tax=Paraburkholderia hospita TaxID=169430 RepID=A0ABP2PHE9_9BURK|nr:response regulator [Paraburkholderia hospita]EIM95913.1 response regulator receiver protein [Paraburkholderia hospita]OUL88065.1 response regulator [Paraburkholderia hospita]
MSTTHLDDQSEVRRLGASRVLVVDDYRGAAIATATYLSLDGIDARVVGGCGDALEAIKNWLPDVVLLDVWMPQRDGFETAEAIQRCAPAPRPFVVAYTCADEEFVMANPASNCFDGYCRKGTSPSELVLIVKRACAQRLPRTSERVSGFVFRTH